MIIYKIAQEGVQPQVIVVDGQEYTVEKRPVQPENKGTDGGWFLTNKRGRTFATVRNEKNPHHMFLVDEMDFQRSAPKFWLTDEDGTLRVLGRR